MKGAIYVFILLVAASALAVASASAPMEKPSADNQWPLSLHVWASNANTKSLEDKFAQSLQAIQASKEDGSESRAGASRAGASTACATFAGPGEKALNNSSSSRAMLNSSNSSSLASAANNSRIATEKAAFPANGSDQQKVGASSSGSFQGFYGLTASKHEIGKSDIRSRMFLSGDFDVDKTVSFTDRGV